MNKQAPNPDKLDKNMAVEETEFSGLRWLNPAEPPFRLTGFPWFEAEGRYRRLPQKASETIRESVDHLANHTAGGQIAFESNSNRIVIRVKRVNRGLMYHMPATGMGGFDLYVGSGPAQQFWKVARFNHEAEVYESELFNLPGSEWRAFTLNFPLYQGVEVVLVGLEPGAELRPPPPQALAGRIVFYGTSITQGGCASRPGMAYPNIMSRALNAEIVNLGFSGNGRGEPEVARFVAEIHEPNLFVLDYEANTGGLDGLKGTLPEFVRILRSRHPRLPILVVSMITKAACGINLEAREKQAESRAYQAEFVKAAREGGDHHIHFLNGEELLSSDYHECTVDGVHPTDLGFMQMARGMEPAVREILSLPR